jgi:phosphatidylglycerophosphate synthase
MCPNLITLVGTILIVPMAYYMNKEQYILASLQVLIIYFTDCLDGYYARKYNQETNFGDFFDHTRDVLMYIIIIYLIYKKIKPAFSPIFIITIIISILLVFIHIGCQERLSNFNTYNNCLKWTKKLCLKKNFIQYTKYFGCGTNVMIIIIFILMCYIK